MKIKQYVTRPCLNALVTDANLDIKRLIAKRSAEKMADHKSAI